MWMRPNLKSFRSFGRGRAGDGWRTTQTVRVNTRAEVIDTNPVVLSDWSAEAGGPSCVAVRVCSHLSGVDGEPAVPRSSQRCSVPVVDAAAGSKSLESVVGMQGPLTQAVSHRACL